MVKEVRVIEGRRCRKEFARTTNGFQKFSYLKKELRYLQFTHAKITPTNNSKALPSSPEIEDFNMVIFFELSELQIEII